MTTVNVVLPDPADEDIRGYPYVRYACTANWRDASGIELMDGRMVGDTFIDKVNVTATPDGALFDWQPSGGAYSSGSLAAIAGVLLACAYRQAIFEAVEDDVRDALAFEFDDDHQPTPGEMA